ncbi:MAG: antibiotic biosynthesis monooxygenase [Capsulimonadales bacterium]|nr:antibiotic biosynthesis monooxygenase [Capsulimonadales bacterium]
MILTVFRSRLRPDAGEAYRAWAEEIETLARRQPGFVSVKTFAAVDGERVTLAEFETEADVSHWREQARHREAQRLGRERFYDEYRVQVCEVFRDYSFTRPQDTRTSASAPTEKRDPAGETH